MNENGKKKREWVKTAAIVFLAVMLALTFFSNTIMNYSLPEVATQYVMSDSITARIRGTGQVESGDPYEVKVTQSRKVSSVAVRVGDKVQKGDVLMYLADEESDELKDARNQLEAAQRKLQDAREAYNKALLSGDITAEGIQAANGNTPTATYRQWLTNAQNEVNEAQKRVDEIEAWQDALRRQININTNTSSGMENETEACENAKDTLEKAKRTRDQLEIEKQEAQAKVNNLENDINSEELQVSGNDEMDDTKLQELKSELTEAKIAFNNAAKALINAELDVEKKQTAYDNAKKALETKREEILANLNSQLIFAGNDLAEANRNLTEKRQALSDLNTMLNNMFNLDTYQQAIADAQDVVNDAEELVDKLMAKAFDATITADISGTVTSINVTAGNTTSAAVPVAVLQPEGQGYTLSFSVTNEQARRLNVGDRADLVNAWRYDDVNVVLASIKPDTSDPGQKKLLTFDVTGNVVAGQTFNVVVGQQSANFDYVVPNSAIREDSNGKFILIVESKPTPLSTRYRAVRVDVEVLASDDSRSAITGGTLYGYSFVITTSTQPVEPGQQVRLADN